MFTVCSLTFKRGSSFFQKSFLIQKLARAVIDSWSHFRTQQQGLKEDCLLRGHCFSSSRLNGQSPNLHQMSFSRYQMLPLLQVVYLPILLYASVMKVRKRRQEIDTTLNYQVTRQACQPSLGFPSLYGEQSQSSLHPQRACRILQSF